MNTFIIQMNDANLLRGVMERQEKSRGLLSPALCMVLVKGLEPPTC